MNDSETVIITSDNLNVFIDNEDYDVFKKYKWWSAALGANGQRYAVTKINGIRISMHRMIMGCKFKDGTIVDHINGNTLDNRKCNLRIGDSTMNMRNRIINKNNNSGISGVWFKPNHGVAGSWIATARINDKCVSKTFGCLRRGYENAQNLAIEWRKKHEEKYEITVRNN